MYSLILIQLVYLIVGVMNLIRFVILLRTGTLCNYVFFCFDRNCLFESWGDGSLILLCMGTYVTVYSFILIQLVCMIVGVMNLIRFVILLCMGTLYNCVFLF